MAVSANTDYLNALANVCEAAQKLQIPVSAGPSGLVSPYYLYPATTTGGEAFAYSSTMERREQPAAASYYHYDFHQIPHFHHHHPQATTVPISHLTPPPTPDNTSIYHQPLPVPQPQLYPDQQSNPLMKSVLAYAQFQHFLDEAWPEDSNRRGSAVIRASLYAKIAASLRGGETGARLKHWIKKSEFFLVERMQPGGEGFEACLAVPVVKSRGCGSKIGCKSSRHSYKLVARLEDFVYIIGAYHNDQRGHPGIRRTYAMIQEDFSYVPRTAVSKFIELCDICALHRPKAITTTSSVLRTRDLNKDEGEKAAKTTTTRRKTKSKPPADLKEAPSTTTESTDCADTPTTTKSDSTNSLSQSKLDATVEQDSQNIEKENVGTV